MSTKETLIEDNLRLVYYIISKEYPNYLRDEDIVQCGMVGLCKAADSYDESKSKFSTFACRCIRNEITLELRSRKKYKNTISLETKIGEEGTLADVLVGEDCIPFIDDESFRKLLTAEENEVLEMESMGFSPDEIVETSGFSIQKVWKILRVIQLKWRNFNGN